MSLCGTSLHKSEVPLQADWLALKLQAVMSSLTWSNDQTWLLEEPIDALNHRAAALTLNLPLKVSLYTG